MNAFYASSAGIAVISTWRYCGVFVRREPQLDRYQDRAADQLSWGLVTSAAHATGAKFTEHRR